MTLSDTQRNAVLAYLTKYSPDQVLVLKPEYKNLKDIILTEDKIEQMFELVTLGEPNSSGEPSCNS